MIEGMGDALASPCTVYNDEIKFAMRGMLDGVNVTRLAFMKDDKNIASVSSHAFTARKPIRTVFNRVNLLEVAGVPFRGHSTSVFEYKQISWQGFKKSDRWKGYPRKIEQLARRQAQDGRSECYRHVTGAQAQSSCESVKPGFSPMTTAIEPFEETYTSRHEYQSRFYDHADLSFAFFRGACCGKGCAQI
jgi:hypothetical protein